MTQHPLLRGATLCATGLLACMALAGCAPQYSSPQQVRATNPTVTYKYQNDQDLVQTSHKAAAFCTPYQSAPRQVSLSSEPDGSKIIVFECVPSTAQQVLVQPTNPNLTYSYRTDQELVDASRSAQTYCQNNGGQQVLATMGTDQNGNKVVTFQCSPARIIR